MTPVDAIQRTIAAAAGGRTSGLFDAAVGAHDGVIVVGATGLLADHALAGLGRLDIPPLALVDNNSTLWGQTIHGAVVLAPDEAVRRYPNAAYVAAIFTHTPLRHQMLKLGASRVVSYAPLFHRHPTTFLPYFAVDDPAAIAAEADAVERAANIWADEESASLYAAILDWFVTLNSDAVPRPLPARDTYFPEQLQLRQDEVFVDCGAFDGDTVRAYAAVSGGQYQAIIAIEPDPDNFARLSAGVAALGRAIVLNAAAGASPGRIPFLASGALSSHAVSAGAQGLTGSGPVVDVKLVRLDDLVPRPSFVKMDIEGFEREALAGARELLAGDETAFAVTLYHRMSDLWQLPLYIHECAPDLRLYLRHYAEDWAETICYAIPADRIRSASRRVDR